MRRALLLAALLLLGGRVLSAPAQPWAVGRVSRVFVDASRGNRSVAAEVHYPATSSGDNVPVAGTPGERFPVVAFGHGYLMAGTAYGWVRDGLVPAGYIVIFPRSEEGLFPSHGAFGRDLAFVIAALEAEGANPSSLFFQRVSDRSAVMGHSMGGGASVLAASYDPRIEAVANLAAAETNPSAIAAAGSVTVPALLFAGTADCVTPPSQHQIPIYDALASTCRTLVTLTGASHCRFAASGTVCELGEGGCPTPGLSRAAQQALTRDVLLPWLDYVLLGRTARWFDFKEILDSGSTLVYAQDCPGAPVVGAPEPAASGGMRLVPLANPSRGSAGLSVELPRAGRARLTIHDVAGRRVAVAFDAEIDAGIHLVTWNGRAEGGGEAPRGVYVARLEGPDGVVAAKITLVR